MYSTSLHRLYVNPSIQNIGSQFASFPPGIKNSRMFFERHQNQSERTEPLRAISIYAPPFKTDN